MSVSSITPKAFAGFRDLVYKKSGILLRNGKESLLCARISRRMRQLSIQSHEEYLDRLLRGESDEEVVLLLDAISTNLTHFFREQEHFDLIKEAMTEWLGNGQRRFRFWCAACSSGQEPYSLMMCLAELLNRENLDLRILATDISTAILEKATRGTYSKSELDKVPSVYRQDYFSLLNRKDGTYQVKPVIKERVLFRRMNLSQPPFPMQGPLDAVFCRNVMIYFDNPVRKRLIEEIHRLLKPGGFLLVGHAESLTGMSDGFKTIKPSVYRRL